jgi:Signal recognition particle 9 kDa protein (SRP9)
LTLKYKVPKQTDGTTNANANAVLVAKAYEPTGGVCLKYETNRAVEVGRLILGFQELGQVMQNVPPTLKRKASSGEEEAKGQAMAIDEPASSAAGKGENGKKSVPVDTTPVQTGGKKKKKARR